MSEFPCHGKEKHLNEEKDEGDVKQPVPSDEEDDFEYYFLEPAGNVNIAEKIAEANKKLLEELNEEKEGEEGEGKTNEIRPRKVQFSEQLVNFEPNYYSDDEHTESAGNSVISEEGSELKPNHKDENSPETNESSSATQLEKNSEEKKKDEDIPEEISEELDADVVAEAKSVIDGNSKFILVLLPREQNSSCESIIGEEVPGEKTGLDEKETKSEFGKTTKTKIIRPKSAKKSCEISKISPNLSCPSSTERKSRQTSRNPFMRTKVKLDESENKNVFSGEIKIQIKGRHLKKVNIDDLSLEKEFGVESLKRCGSSRPGSYFRGSNTASAGGDNRPKTAPTWRTCCVIRTELPRYNGLRSEYGLSAEQLEEREQKTLEIRKKKKEDQMKKRQEEIRKRNENEETFQKWLFNKRKKTLKKKSITLTDTLTRSDFYIQTHASYAANRNVPYSLDYSIGNKIKNRKRESRERKNKKIAVGKLLANMTPHVKRSFNIYLGALS